MIVLPTKRLVIITPPHTASGNLHRALCAPPYSGFWVMGPWHNNMTYDQHAVYIPKDWGGYKVALVVRDPFDRLAGLWLHYDWSRRTGTLDSFSDRNLSWPQFVAAVAEDDPCKLTAFFRWTIARIMQTRAIVHALVRYERLQADVDELIGEHVSLADPYHGPHDLAAYYADPVIRRTVSAWAQPDLLRYGYAPPRLP